METEVTFPVVKVTWVDACTYTKKSMGTKNLPTRESIGYLTRKDLDAVGVCYLRDIPHWLSITDVENEDEGIVIPSGMVQKIEYYIKKNGG